MKKVKALPASRLSVSLAPSRLGFSHSGSVRFGSVDFKKCQERAYEALELALTIERPGYNVYLSGEKGLGRTRFVRDFLDPRAASKKPPSDWVYVNNFQDPDQPLAISLPPGQAKGFKRDLAAAVKRIRESIPSGFEQDFYVRKHGDLIKDYNDARESLLSRMENQAHKNGFSLNVDESGSLTLFPLVEGKVLTPEEFEKLNPDLRRSLKDESSRIMEALLGLSRQISKKEQDLRENEKQLDREVAAEKVDSCLKEIIAKYSGIPRISQFVEDLKNDVLDNLEHFKPREQPQDNPADLFGAGHEGFFSRYEVNIFVDNSSRKGAPVLIEDNPVYFNLLGCIERESEMGTYYTDFTLLKAGSLHKANGGFLVLRAEDILSQPQSWEGLLRCLRSGRAEIDDPSDHYDTVRTRTIRPEPIVLDIKIIIIGSDEVYEILLDADERFAKLFKIKAHMQESMPRNNDSVREQSLILAAMARDNDLRSFHREAVAALIDHSSRLAGDQQKLSLKFSLLAELMVEADAFASMAKSEMVAAQSVHQALEARKYRLNLYEDEFLAEYEREAIKVQTQGHAIGRANGLSVSAYGDYILALPHQISCTTGVGHGGIMDLEREAELGGPIHTKGMMIIKGYLQNLFAQDKPLVLSGSLCFEQSYAHIDGDSASGAELAALLSALSSVPINLSYAFTGAVSQSGAIMAVGEVTRKVEGYFEVCRRKGLTGNQGVIIPVDNVTHLMLSDAVVQAARQGSFHIFAVENIEQALEILTGIRAGKKLANGGFSPGSIYHKANERLRQLAHLADQKVRRSCVRKKK
ncbi:Lon protease family protein [Desulfonatronovibrio hydrogenovorans]|uniref:Lon protease family protein n=1 Tax=Desulfonatronovibrio hydrogenovorans TaxID=53245 RepID=UPI0004918122|nr:ATP-binding protein [Desulfonatronovibrio hydrogenovorans]